MQRGIDDKIRDTPWFETIKKILIYIKRKISSNKWKSPKDKRVVFSSLQYSGLSLIQLPLIRTSP